VFEVACRALLDDALQRVLRDAARSGTVTVGAAERCCDVLGWHPRMLWAETYDQAITDDTPHTATAPPGSTTAWRQGCRCLDCREANRAAISRTKAACGSGRPRDPSEPPISEQAPLMRQEQNRSR
jgi:hypothetical protein